MFGEYDEKREEFQVFASQEMELGYVIIGREKGAITKRVLQEGTITAATSRRDLAALEWLSEYRNGMTITQRPSTETIHPGDPIAARAHVGIVAQHPPPEVSPLAEITSCLAIGPDEECKTETVVLAEQSGVDVSMNVTAGSRPTEVSAHVSIALVAHSGDRELHKAWDADVIVARVENHPLVVLRDFLLEWAIPIVGAAGGVGGLALLFRPLRRWRSGAAYRPRHASESSNQLRNP